MDRKKLWRKYTFK